MLFQYYPFMPSIWDDVRFDHAAAADLRDELGATAVAIFEAMTAVDDETRMAGEGWLGAYHLDFLAERTAWSTIAGQLVASIEDTIVAVARAAETALADQAVRLALRDRLVGVGAVVVDPAAPGGGGEPGG